MTLPEPDPRQDRVSEMVERARRLLTTRGTWSPHGILYWRDQGILIVEDTVRTFSIDIVTENVGSYGMVYRKPAGYQIAEIVNHNVPQALHILRQIMVLDDLARA